MKKICLSLILLFFAPLTFAVTTYTSYFCSATGDYVNVGDSIDQVTKTCGEPSKTTSVPVRRQKMVAVEQWIFNRRIPIVHDTKEQTNYMYAPIKYYVNFKNDKVSQIISRNGATNTGYFCGVNSPIHIGDSKQQVENLCGTPADVQEAQQAELEKPKAQLIYIYQKNIYDNQIWMYFEGLKLSKIEERSPQ